MTPEFFGFLCCKLAGAQRFDCHWIYSELSIDSSMSAKRFFI